MERKKIVICCVVGFLGLLSAATAFAVEATKIKHSDIKSTPLKCVYPKSTPSFVLGITSLVSLVITMFLYVEIIPFLLKDLRKPPQPNSNRRTNSAGCLLVSWITGGYACVLLVYGIVCNSQHGEMKNNYGSCQFLTPGIATQTGILSLVSVVFSIINYLSITSTSINSVNSPSDDVPAAPSQGDIAMGQLHIPPLSHEPVFVDEDTYMRRYFP